jgi:hypothetical protein
MVKCTVVRQPGHFTPSLRSRRELNRYVSVLIISKARGVKKEKKTNRNKRIYIRLTGDEYKILHDGFSKSIFRKFSEYNREILLNKPVTIFTRNKSYDDFVEEMAALRTELNAIGNNFNQAVKKLHTINHDEEIIAWAVMNEKAKELFNKKMDQIELKMIKISEQWSQE